MTHDMQDHAVDICVCTFRRPGLTQTLESLRQQVIPPGVDVAILVVDNDDTPSARGRVMEFAETSPIPVRYVHCPAGNISIARNGALDHGRARYLAFIDDDEVASERWLAALLDCARTEAADVVLGPVQSVYESDAPGWMQRLDLHSTWPVWVKGQIRTGYTCNVLIDRASPALAGRRFDLALGQSGGEDTVFFAAAFEDGGRIGYADSALIREDVPPQRATLGWLMRRRFRMGQTHGRLTAQQSSRAPALVAAAAKLTYCAGAVVLTVFSAAGRNGALLRGTLHAGAIAGLMGARELQLYAAAPSTATGERRAGS